jgi:hypothetical protein
MLDDIACFWIEHQVSLQPSVFFIRKQLDDLLCEDCRLGEDHGNCIRHWRIASIRLFIDGPTYHGQFMTGF